MRSVAAARQPRLHGVQQAVQAGRCGHARFMQGNKVTQQLLPESRAL